VTPPNLLLRRLLPVLVVLAARAHVAGAQGQERREYTEVHLGMPVRVVVHAPDDEAARRAARAAFARIAILEGMMSDYRPQSELRRLEARPGEWVAVSAELFDVLGRALHTARVSGGAFDPTVAPLVALWREARRTGQRPDPVQIAAARRVVGWTRVALDTARTAVRLEPGTRLDLGGVAKGFILQDAMRELRRSGVRSALIEAGGDIVVGDAPPGQRGWHVDVPGASAEFARRAASLTNAAIATSGPAAQFVVVGGVRYSHVVDPRTGMALTNQVTTHVIAADAALADALATAFVVLDIDAATALLRRTPDVFADFVVARAPRT
jgi:thiamine biosynthesis lipoprotein